MPLLSVALVTPISPAQPGNGLAHRARSWQRTLAGLGRVTTILVPVAGEAQQDDAPVVALTARSAADPRLPTRASRAPEWLGRGWRSVSGSPFALAVGLRADVAPFTLGLAAGTHCRVVIDLDDDDVAYHRSRGDHAEADRYDALRRQVLDRAHLVTAVRAADGVCAVPNSWPLPSGAARPAAAAGPPRLLMVGNFHYAPNAEGLAWFCEHVLPLLPGAELVVVGPGSEDLSPHGRGYVQDLAEVYARATVVVVPLLHGSGSRIKALEAFAQGVPVVGTTLGLAGLDVSDGVHCLLADSPTAFAEQVRRIADDPGLAQRLADDARAHLAARFSAEEVESTVRARLSEVLQDVRHGLLRLAPGLHVAETADGVVVAEETGSFAHRLNAPAAAVLALADGRTTRDTIAEQFAAVTGTTREQADEVVRSASDRLLRAGVLVEARQGRQSD